MVFFVDDAGCHPFVKARGNHLVCVRHLLGAAAVRRWRWCRPEEMHPFGGLMGRRAAGPSVANGWAAHSARPDAVEAREAKREDCACGVRQWPDIWPGRAIKPWLQGSGHQCELIV